MQTRNDGKHAILPAAGHLKECLDRVGMPVTLPRESDGKMHRDGKSAADMQPETAVDECAGVHGAPDLSILAANIAPAGFRVFYCRVEEKRRC